MVGMGGIKINFKKEREQRSYCAGCKKKFGEQESKSSDDMIHYYCEKCQSIGTRKEIKK